MQDQEQKETVERELVRPLTGASWRYHAFVGILLAIVSVGVYAYITQLQQGLVVTGMRSTVLWGLYITNFIFFIGISHAGTLVSAILRVTGAEWRRPITRMAEAITVFALMVGGSMVLIDLGRPDRLLNLLLYGRLQSPLIWDFISIATYLTGSLLYLYLPLLPDLAALRNSESIPTWKRKICSVLSLRWTGSEKQKVFLEKAIFTMAIIIIPVAVSVHTVVSWVFGMTLRTGWNSTIFGPYFVVGAIFSGIAAILAAMAFFRRYYHLEAFITPQHFKNIAKLLLALDIAYVYFTISEYLTASYKGETLEGQLLSALFTGPYGTLFLFFELGGLVVPALLLVYGLRKGRHPILAFTVAAILVNMAMWVKRYIIVVPTLALPQLAYDWGSYTPTWVEVSITAAAFAGFILLYTLFSRLFPIVSIWETSGEIRVQDTMPARSLQGSYGGKITLQSSESEK